MQFFWLPSFTAENPMPPRAWQQLTVLHSLENAPVEGAAMILEIGCEADSERAADLLDVALRSTPVWIYDPAANVGSAVAWIKSGAAHVVNSADELELAMDCLETDPTGMKSDSGEPEGPDADRPGPSTMIGRSRCMQEVQSAI